MPAPRVPGSDDDRLELPCGETVRPVDLDMGVRDLECDCGDRHAVVVDAHPLSRFVPESVVETLRAAIETADEFEEFGLVHAMGMVTEEFPDAVATEDVSEDGRVGYALLWVCDFDSRRLHEIVVELLVELMEHAASHGDEGTATQFEQQMLEFDVGAFVDAYRRERGFDSEFDTPA
ncbi:hypothetical protein KM295_09905 [Natronomonas sp. F2-12]|jgi:hypothetical protein|uniref:Uncharacterized protein n=1 Tax=Natronomonas aquatica TaxID=2841590 RepID=A0A9R1CRE1_9EURY|nr:DUF5815 family protein [Natronomonas aquatica]MCQ4333788.1 hypothetical protein [Natronomonas aquatica]